MDDLKMIRPLEHLLLMANLKSSKQEKVVWALAESIPKKFWKFRQLSDSDGALLSLRLWLIA